MRTDKPKKTKFPHVKGLQTKRTKNGQRYVLTETDKDGKTHSITVKISESDDEKTFLRKVDDARAILHKRKSDKTFDDYIDEFVKTRVLSKNTEMLYRYCLKGFSFDDRQNEKQIKEMLTMDVKPSTTSLYITKIKIFFTWLAGKIPYISNPSDDIKLKNNSQPRSRTLTDDEIKMVHEYANKKEPLYKLFILLLLYTGARVSSIIAIRKKDLTKKGLTLYNVKCKKYYDYLIPISNKDIINLWKECFEIGSIFGQNGIKYSNRLNAWLYISFGKDAKGETISIHSFRHTFASRAAMNGIPMEIISKLLDHQSISTTAKFYARFSQKQINDAVSKTIKGYQK